MLAHADSSTGLVYICNPNNPTATLTPRKDIESFICKLPGNVTILIDEAYCHFVSPHLGFATFLEHPFDDPRLVVCRTFSKVYGLAGMRVGYAVGAPDLLRRLSDRRLQYGISAISAIAAAGAVDEDEQASGRRDFGENLNTPEASSVYHRFPSGPRVIS